MAVLDIWTLPITAASKATHGGFAWGDQAVNLGPAKSNPSTTVLTKRRTVHTHDSQQHAHEYTKKEMREEEENLIEREGGKGDGSGRWRWSS